MEKSATSSSQRPWQKSVAAAVALAVSGAIVAPMAMAQSTTVGNVFGQVTANAGDTVTVKNQDTGVERTVAVGANGRFLSSALPPGKYLVTLNKGGAPVSKLVLDVLAGRGTEAVFSTELEEVVVTGAAAAIDVSSTTNGTLFDATSLAELPVANHDLNGIMTLATSTVKADSRYDGGISIGGGGPSENAYYINGFAVTNPLTQLGSMELPYGAIKQVQVQTGGYGAEFGRSVGGVVNVITKNGGAEWHGGAAVSWEPDSLRASEHNLFYGKTGATTDGTLYRYTKDNSTDVITYSANIGGPVIADKLYFFAAADLKKTDDKSVNVENGSGNAATSGWKDSTFKNKRYLAKVDWYISEDHRLEGTALGDNYTAKDRYSGYDYATFSPGAYKYTESAKNFGGVTPGVGGDAQILKYTGHLLDNLTITALYGQSKYQHKDTFAGVDITKPQVRYSTTNTARLVDPRLVNPANITLQNFLPPGTTGIAPGAHESTKSYRFDLEWGIGSHLLRAGVDINKLKSVGAGEIVLSPQTSDTIIAPGLTGAYYLYASTTSTATATGTTAIYRNSYQTQSLAAAGATPDASGRWYYVRVREFGDITNAESNQAAQYIEDRWQVTDTLQVTGGIRNESFYNVNGAGEKFLKMDSFISPRLSASWDVHGDASMKVYGSAGRYSVQVPTHIAVRGASPSALLDRYYRYTGVDAATGKPTGLIPLGNWFSGNNEYGQDKAPLAVSGSKMKPTYQDEATLGIDAKVLPDYVGGVSFTYRKLKASMDDFCDYRVIDAYAAKNNINITADPYPFGCATINVGTGNTLYFDVDGSGKQVKFALSAADLGLPKAKRNYTALNLYLEHPFKDKWYGKMSYTWSKSRGNTEGQTKSDTGQSDVATTSTWDFKEIMEYSYGNLPNDRRHQIKGFGYYQAFQQVGFSASFVAESGRPKNCLGLYAGTGEDIYGGYNQFFYCDGKPTPRGSQGRLPWNYSLDLGVVYKPSALEGLAVRADVFNVMNTQRVLSMDELHEDSSGKLPTYGRPLAYSSPRSVRLTVSYDF